MSKRYIIEISSIMDNNIKNCNVVNKINSVFLYRVEASSSVEIPNNNYILRTLIITKNFDNDIDINYKYNRNSNSTLLSTLFTKITIATEIKQNDQNSILIRNYYNSPIYLYVHKNKYLFIIVKKTNAPMLSTGMLNAIVNDSNPEMEGGEIVLLED